MPHPNTSLPKPVPSHQMAPDTVRCMEVYLTNLCNMSCINCAVACAKGRKDAKTLSWKQLKGAIDIFMDPEQVPSHGEKAVLFAGGEPFMVYPLLLRAVKHLNGFSRRPSIYIYTNGSLLKPKQLDELRKLGCIVIFSIDGDKKGNDLFRRFRGGKRSVYDEIMKKIKSIRVNEAVATSSVLRPGNLDGILKALDDYRKLGFRACDIWIDYLQVWEPEHLEKLQKFMEAFADYYVEKTEKEGRVPFYVPMLHHAIFNAANLNAGKAWWRDCFRITLGPDGNFYDCQGVLAFPSETVRPGSGLGDAGRGRDVDWSRRQAYMDEAAEWLDGIGADKDWQHVCPRVYYKIMRQMGKDPKPMIDNLHNVSRVFLKGLLKAATRLREHPSFKDLYVTAECKIPG